MTTPADILERAAEIVEQGWTQGAEARDAEGVPCDPLNPRATSRCALGAILATQEGWVAGLSARRVLQEALTQEHGLHAVGSPIIIWNDHPKRTKAEVVAAMRGAARKWREEHENR